MNLSQLVGKPRWACWIWVCVWIAGTRTPATAQAFTPEVKELSFTTSYNYVAFGGHFRSDGSRTPEAAAKAQSVLFGLEYGITDKLAVTFSVPIVATRYASNNPPSDVLRGLFEETLQAVGPGFYRHEFLDDGQYHATIQDFYISARYRVMERPLLLTPFVAVGTPSHDYAYVGEAAPGRNLPEVQLGTFAGRDLGPFLRHAFMEGQFSFAIPESSLTVRTVRTNLAFEFDYLFTRKFAVRGIANWQHTFNGLHFPRDLTTPELALTHERLLKANYWHLGGGVEYSVTPKTDISADFVTFLTGSDTHYGTGVSFSVTRAFNLGSRKHRD
jgi:hypothetical protein